MPKQRIMDCLSKYDHHYGLHLEPSKSCALPWWVSRHSSYRTTNSLQKSRIRQTCCPCLPRKSSESSLQLNPPHPPTPPVDCLKLNVDAAVSNTKASIAVVARNHDGIAIKVRAKIINLCSPIQAEATAILWAVHLAKDEAWTHIIVEGDARCCFDALSNAVALDWTISTSIVNIHNLAPSRAGSMNLGALGEYFKWGLLFNLIINSYIFSFKIYFSYFLRGKITNLI